MIVNGSIFLQKKFSVTFAFHWSMMRLSSYSVVWISFFKPCFSSILPLNMVLIFFSVTLIAKGSPLRFSTENLSWGYPLRCFPEPVLFWNKTFKIASLVLWNEWILCLISQCLTSNLCTLGVGKCSRQNCMQNLNLILCSHCTLLQDHFLSSCGWLGFPELCVPSITVRFS